jgi:hypothetical protein
LITRVRARVDWLGVLRSSPLYVRNDPDVVVMERKMLSEIKRHAEGGVDERLENEATATK